jgi:RNA polymerase sigma factor (sigma-70 family)
MTPRRLREPARLAGAVLRTQTDERLVDLVRDGNDRAFEAIVHRYRRPLLRYCGRFLAPARAEDAVQQTFVNAFGAIQSGDADINLRPWLYRIAHNAALNVLRQAGADHDEISEQIDGVETPPQALERGERLRAVVTAVRKLPERQRDALVLQAVEGRSYDEIAVALGVSGGAVRQLLNRARTTLREGVTALTPPALLLRLGGAIDAPVPERVAQVVTGAGGGAALAKVAAIVVVGGAAVGGAGDRVLVHHGGDHKSAALAAPAKAKPAARDRTVALTTSTRRSSHGHDRSTPDRNSGHGSTVSDNTGSGNRNEVRPEVEHHGSSGPSGSGSGGSDDHHSSSGSGDTGRSGSDGGTSGGGDDHSGSGSGSSGSGGSDDATATTPVEDSAPLQSDPLTTQSKDDNSGSGGGGTSGSGSSGSSNDSGGDG